MTHPDIWLSRFQREDGIFLDQASRQFVAYSRLPGPNWVLISVLPASSIQAVVASASPNVLRDHRAGQRALTWRWHPIWSRYFRRMLDEIPP